MNEMNENGRLDRWLMSKKCITTIIFQELYLKKLYDINHVVSSLTYDILDEIDERILYDILIRLFCRDSRHIIIRWGHENESEFESER